MGQTMYTYLLLFLVFTTTHAAPADVVDPVSLYEQVISGLCASRGTITLAQECRNAYNSQQNAGENTKEADGDKVTVSTIINDRAKPKGCFIETITDNGGTEFNDLVFNKNFDSTAPYSSTQKGWCTSYVYVTCKNKDGKLANENSCECGSGTDSVICADGKSVCNASAPTCGCPAGEYFHTDDESCTKCGDGSYSIAMSTSEDDCIPGSDCPAGTKTNTFTQACDSCGSGFYGDETGAASCKECPGKANSAVGSDERNDCSGCGAGYQFTSNNPACEVCTAGQYMDETTTSVTPCKNCSVGKFLSDPGRTADFHNNVNDCFKCQEGTISNPDGGSDYCFSCGPGQYQDTVGPNNIPTCKYCPAGFFTDDKGKEQCDSCPSGYIMSKENSPFCLPCGSGTYTDQTSQTECKKCVAGRYRQYNESNLRCVKCPKGFRMSFQGSASCVACSPGKWAPRDGKERCDDCPPLKYADSFGTGSYKKGFSKTCKDCPGGWDTGLKISNTCKDCPGKGVTTCLRCSIGRFGTKHKQCANCPKGKFQNKAEEEVCLLPAEGKIANKEGTAEVKPPWRTASDCDPDQFLNDTDVDKQQWQCIACPEGGSCAGAVVWKNIRAKNGYWRIRDEGPRSQIPLCYVLKKCQVFSPCVFPPACLGASNPSLVSVSGSFPWPNATENHNETCNEALGFRGRSRLCQTCGVGYSRTWGSQCVSCGLVDGEDRDYSYVISLFSVFVTVGLLFFGALVGLRKRAFANDATSNRRRKSIHSTMKRILLSHFQTLSTVINLRVPWPSVLTLILDALSSMSGSFGDSVNVVECLYADQSHTDFYLGALIAVAVLPFLFVMLLALYWFFGATKSSAMGCGQTVTWRSGEGSSRWFSGEQQHQHEDGHSSTEGDAPSPAIKCARSGSVVAHEKFRVTATDALIMSSVLFWFMILPSGKIY